MERVVSASRASWFLGLLLLAALSGCEGCEEGAGGASIPPGSVCASDTECFNGQRCDLARSACVPIEDDDAGGEGDSGATEEDSGAGEDAGDVPCEGAGCPQRCEPACPVGEVCVGTMCVCEPGAERACGSKLGECRYGVQRCDGGAWGACEGGVLPAEETCDHADNDCDGAIDEGVELTFFEDQDGDGAGASDSARRGCEPGPGTVTQGGDCDDDDPGRAPGLPEACDGVDNDCDALTDEGLPEVSYVDNDLDGFGDPDAPRAGCDVPAGYAAQAGDCDDAASDTYPGAPEVCDGLDNSCDGQIDEGAAPPPEAACPDTGVCAGTQPVCTGPEGWACRYLDTPFEVVEVSCDGLDNDCDGLVDEAIRRPCGVNRGVCTQGEERCAEGTWVGCSATTGIPATESEAAADRCDGLDNDCDGLTDEGCACQEGQQVPCGSDVGTCTAGLQTCEGGVYGACSGQGPVAERCDAAFLDQDCDGLDDIAEGLATRYYVDQDRDSVGAGAARYRCGALQAGESARGDDCDDANPQRYPGADEVCNGLDDDCDGAIDDAPSPAPAPCLTQGACAGTTPTCRGAAGWACLYTSPNYQSAETRCDSLDNDCDGRADEGLTITVYADQDRDTYGAGASLQACAPLRAGQSANAQDCDDADQAVHPGAEEICYNTVDEDCDGVLDNGCATCNPAIDADFDGANQCDDCDEANGAVHPGAAERCNGIDDDCDGEIDEDFDRDRDGWSVCATRPQDVDCDDTRPTIHPTAAEQCGASGQGNGIDDNCNGYIDEGCGSCDPNDTDGDTISECDGDCAPSNGAVYPGAAELCDGLDNDCNTNTTLNCEVSEPCSWAANDTCADDLLCACVVNNSGACTGSYVCTALCNTSVTGALGDGCEADQTCAFDILRSANVHGCSVVQDTLGTRLGGESCGSDAECRSHTCARVATGPNGRICLDYCGSDAYCDAAGTVCRLLRGADNLDGRCWPSSSAALGSGAVGSACTRDDACDHGLCAADGASRYCTEACCTDADCPSGFHCGLDGDALDTSYVTVPPDAAACTSDAQCSAGMVCFTQQGRCAWRLAETSPMCLRDSPGQGARLAGAACADNSQCASDFCERELGVCVDVCCADDACPDGLTCELMTIQSRADRATSARVCVNLSTDGVLERR